MSRPRMARPTDIVALVAFDGRVYHNEARPWERLGHEAGGSHALGSALEQWFSFATGRATWVSVQGQTVRGVISARRRATRTAWEIDTLIAAAEDETGVALSLFDQVVAGAVGAGVQKLFLRLDAGSELLTAARAAGFVAYQRETLLRAESPLTADSPLSGLSLRPCAKGDAFALYQLYTRAAPPDVRQVEAATFQEWLAVQDERARGRGRLDLIALSHSRAMARVRTCREPGLGKIDLVVHPDAWPDTEMLIGLGLDGLRPDQPAFCLVPHHAPPVLNRLERVGFAPVAEYVTLAKRLALPVRALRPRRVTVPTLVKPLIAKPLAPATSAEFTVHSSQFCRPQLRTVNCELGTGLPHRLLH